MRIEMPYEAEWIIDNIRSHGYEAFIVGGCVRDAVLGRIPGDWDITTSAKPEQVKEIFGKTVDTGLKHGTVTIIKHGSGYEVTTYRIDGEYLDGRHPETVEFTPDLREDLKRRDFTINAMAYSHETGIVDEFEGMEDLKRRVIRCVGCAKDRFTEDALRILRAVRFAAQLDFVIEDETYKAIAEIAPNLVHVSKERIQVELTKLLLSDHPEKIWMVDATGIAEYVTPGFTEVFERELESRNSMDPLKECWAGIAALPADKSHRWAGFLRHMTAEQAVKILRGLKLDNDTIGNVKNMITAFQAPLTVDKVEIRRLLSRVTEYQFLGAMQLKKLDGDETVPGILRLFEEIKEAGDCVSLKQLAVNGGDLLAKGLEKGKQIGDGLMYLLNLVLEKPELNKREKAILRFIEKQIMTQGYPPSVREIGKAVGLSSTATVHGYLSKLDEKGYIKKQDKKGRTLRLLKGGSGEEKKTSSKEFYTQKELVEVPIIGKITAGEPILAVENVTDTFPIPVDFVGNSESFMLTVRGESMIESGILDGDYILVKRQNMANNGEIVVALIGDEATVKTFYKEKDHIRLQPENSTMDPIIVPTCEILGKVAGVFRKM